MVSLSQKVRRNQPHCIYCGGMALGDDIDHVPPTGLFDGAWRPKGGEVTVCKPCHTGTRELDDVAGFVSRFFPNPQTDAQQADVTRSIRSFIRNYPHLVNEAGRPEPYEQIEGAGSFHVGPLMRSVMTTFAARVGLALHHRMTGEIIGPNGGIFAHWYTNYQGMEGRLPDEFLETLGPGYTMVQGTKDVGDQFSFAFSTGSDHGATGYWATFRKSFATMTFVSQSVSDFSVVRPIDIYRPGFLQGYSVKRLGEWPGQYGLSFSRPYWFENI